MTVLILMKQNRATPSATLSHLPTLLTSVEVMPKLRVTKGTLCAWVRAGKINAYRRPDGSYLFDEADIVAWLQSRKVTQRKVTQDDKS